MVIKGDITPFLIGSTGLTFPLWGTWLSSGWNIALGVAGAIVLGLTIYNKILEIKQRRRDLKKK